MISYPIVVDGISTRVLQAGLAGDAVVFVHGTGGRAGRWERNLDAVAAAGYRCYAFDLPGHGFATKGAGPAYSVPGYAAVLEAFLDTLDAERVSLVGTSIGGHVVASYAVGHQDRIASLTLVGSMGLVPIGDEAAQRIGKGATNQSREGVRAKLQRVIHDPLQVSDEFAEEEFRVNNSPGADVSFQQLGSYIAGRLDQDVVGDRVAALAERVPVQLIWGAEDTTVPLSVGRAVADAIPQASLTVIDAAAHTCYFEQPAVFNQALVEFLAAARAGAATR